MRKNLPDWLNFARADADLKEKTGTIVLQGGQVYYRKPNDSVRYGPFKSITEAKAAAEKAGVRMDDCVGMNDANEAERYYSQWQQWDLNYKQATNQAKREEARRKARAARDLFKSASAAGK